MKQDNIENAAHCILLDTMGVFLVLFICYMKQLLLPTVHLVALTFLIIKLNNLNIEGRHKVHGLLDVNFYIAQSFY